MLNDSLKMTCCHYLVVIYGVKCTKAFIKKMFNFAQYKKDYTDNYGEENIDNYSIEYDFFSDIEVKHKNAKICAHSLKKHGFGKHDDEEIIIGINLPTNGDMNEINLNFFQSLNEHNGFFSQFNKSPSLFSIMSGCSCCS